MPVSIRGPRRQPRPTGARLTWVVEDLGGREEAWSAGQLLQGAVHAAQPLRVRQEGGQALLGVSAGACGHRGSSARCPGWDSGDTAVAVPAGSPSSPSSRCESPTATLMGEKSKLASGWAASAMCW